jgi:O-antigen/teichoic acid export membrane protein
VSLGLLTTIVAARLLGPAEYGVATLIMAYPSLVFSVISVKSIDITTRYMASFHHEGRADELMAICKLGYGLDLLVGISSLVIVSVTAWWAIRWYLEPTSHMAILMVAYASTLPLRCLRGTSLALTTALERFRWIAVLYVLEGILSFVAVLLPLLMGSTVSGMVLGTAAGNACTGMLMLASATYLLHLEGYRSWWKTPLKAVAPLKHELRTLLGWNYLVVTLSGVVGQVPLMFLGRYRGPAEAGMYRLVTTIANAGGYLEGAMAKVVFPHLSQRWLAGELDGTKQQLRRWTIRAGLPAGALLLGAVILLPLGVPQVFGPHYSHMIVAAQVMLMGTAISSTFFWLHSYYYAAGRVYEWTQAWGLYTVLVILSAVFVVPRQGLIGLAVADAIARTAFTLLMLKGTGTRSARP